MKKSIFIALALGFMAVSCSRENDDVVTTPSVVAPQIINPLVGKWQKTKHIIHNNNDQEIEADDCEKKSVLEFANNGNLIATDYLLNNITNTCDLQPATPNTERYEYNTAENKVTYRGTTFEIVKVTALELHLKAGGSTTIFKKL